MLQNITLAGGRIEFRRIGGNAPDAPVLVFLHEGLGCAALWKDFPDQLAAATGMPALVYSRFGYGGSDPCRLPRPLSYMHDEAETVLPELLARLDIRAYALAGHSDGASIALIHAGAPRPGLRAVAVMAPHVFCEDISVRSISAARDAFVSGDLRARLGRYHGANVDVAFHGWCDAWLDPAFRAWNIEACLPAISVPVLVVQGEGDEYGTMEQVRRISAQVRSPVTIAPLADCGHSPQRDRPQETLAVLREFFLKNQ